MQLHGQGGMGKTKLIQAITDLFHREGCSDQLAKTALSGVAACQIGGSTLHSWATIPAGQGLPHSDAWVSRPSPATAQCREVNMHNKFMLIVDEKSMMTLDFLWLLSQVVSAYHAKAGLPVAVVTLPFGGLTVLIAGDFHQFPPVSNINRALYSQFPNTSCSQLSKNIYEQFITVVTQHQQMRIVDPVWDQLLQCARVGECTSIDLDEIRHLLLFNNKCSCPDFSIPPWDDVILITPRNSIQIRWNIRAVIKHSISSSSMLYLCPAEDSAHGSLLSLSQHFSVARLTLKETEHLPTVLRLVQGMCVMVTRNLASMQNFQMGPEAVFPKLFWILGSLQFTPIPLPHAPHVCIILLPWLSSKSISVTCQLFLV